MYWIHYEFSFRGILVTVSGRRIVAGDRLRTNITNVNVILTKKDLYVNKSSS